MKAGNIRHVVLGDIAKISSGGTPSRATPEYWGGDIPWVKTGQIQNGRITHASIEEWITDRGLKESSAKMIKAGNLLMAMYGQGKTRGQVAILEIDASINQACAAIELSSSVDRDYIFQFLRFCYERIRQMSNTGGQENLSSGLIKEIPVVLPPLSEQKAIADLLSIWDDAIKKIELLIEAKKHRFRGLMQELLYEPIKKNNWDQLRASELFDERREGARLDLPLLSITGSRGVIPREDTERKDTSSEDKSKYLRICTGDIGYNTMRMWQGVSALSSLEGIVSPAYTICTPREQLIPEFVAYLFKLPIMIHKFYRYSQGLTSDTWNLKFRHFSEVLIPVPSLDEQESICGLLDVSAKEIEILSGMLEGYKTQKRGLMQKLLTGEWRVNS